MGQITVDNFCFQTFAGISFGADFCTVHCAELSFAGLTWEASGLKTLYLKSDSVLLISDCHFGKTSHFRAHAIPLPQAAALPDFKNLFQVLNHYRPQTCIFLGDLFHSAGNQEWQWLTALCGYFKDTVFQLVQGNHDILPASAYENAGFLVSGSLELAGVILLHEPPEKLNGPCIYGHLHPGITLRGKARQSVSMPCFYQLENQLIMPAFGSLTGHINMSRHMPGGEALCIVNEKLIRARG